MYPVHALSSPKWVWGGGTNLFFEECVWLNVKCGMQEYFWVALISKVEKANHTQDYNTVISVWFLSFLVCDDCRCN